MNAAIATTTAISQGLNLGCQISRSSVAAALLIGYRCCSSDINIRDDVHAGP